MFTQEEQSLHSLMRSATIAFSLVRGTFSLHTLIYLEFNLQIIQFIHLQFIKKDKEWLCVCCSHNSYCM